MQRSANEKYLLGEPRLADMGLSPAMIGAGITYVHTVLDGLDATLLANGETRLAGLIELANLSAVVGNLLRGGLANASEGRFVANGPHKYPDLLSTIEGHGDLEIKVALEKNSAKGHLPKPGPHLICRYVLADEDGAFLSGREHRGDVAWIWEIRAGILSEEHFNTSNTAGDSGKTAVINKAGFDALKPAYVNLELCPYGARSSIRKYYEKLMQPVLQGLG